MSIAIRCPHCGDRLEFADELAGWQACCRACDDWFVVPERVAQQEAGAESTTSVRAGQLDDRGETSVSAGLPRATTEDLAALDLRRPDRRQWLWVPIAGIVAMGTWLLVVPRSADRGVQVLIV